MSMTIIQHDVLGNGILVVPDIQFSEETMTTEGDDPLTTEVPELLITEGL